VNAVALITGASRGIGRGIALELAKIGCDLVINYLENASAAEQTASECLSQAQAAGRSISARLCQADISQRDGRQRLIDFTRAQFQHLDLLVNNAGIAPDRRVDILEGSEASFDRLINVNVKGPYFLTQLAARLMLEQVKSGVRSDSFAPKIVTISSISAFAASTNRGDYCIAKAALSMLTPLYAVRLAEYGINVYEIRPGIVQTDMTRPVHDKYDQLIKDGLTPIKRWGTPQDIGKAVVAIAQDSLPFSTGEVINVDGGFHIHRL